MADQGRPTKYKKEYDELAYNYCLLGATDADLARFFSVSESTINLWKLEHSSFSESLKDGKYNADANVAKALYHRALGYVHTEEKVFNNNGDIVTYNTLKHYPPDTGAAMAWLKNRQPDKWRDKQEIVQENHNYNEDMTDEERKARIAKLKAKLES